MKVCLVFVFKAVELVDGLLKTVFDMVDELVKLELDDCGKDGTVALIEG